MRRQRKYWISAACLVIPALLMAAYLGVLQLSGNFHEVLPGELYRSNQLSPTEITEYKQDYRIQTILNLRGQNKGEEWYDAEIAQAKQENINHIDFMMLSEKELNHDDALRLIAIMAKAPKPLLIHCNAGANRTSLASALYLGAIEGKNEETSEDQFSFLYGHFPMVFRGTYAMDKTYDELEYLFHADEM